MLDIVFSDRDSTSKRKAQRAKAMTTWDIYVKLRNLLHTPFQYGKAFVLCMEAEIHALWNSRAEVVESTAVKFLEAFRASCNGIGEGSWYLHCTLAHIPGNIRTIFDVWAHVRLQYRGARSRPRVVEQYSVERLKPYSGRTYDGYEDHGGTCGELGARPPRGVWSRRRQKTSPKSHSFGCRFQTCAAQL